MYMQETICKHFSTVNRLERTTVRRKRVFAVLKVLGSVLEQLSKDISPEEADELIPEEVTVIW